MNKQNSSLENFADLLDRRFTIPGTGIRFGVDAVIGLLPGIGDWIGGLAALYIPVYAAAKEVSAPVVSRMFLNILVDVLIGAIPFLGDLFDLSWKANVRNAELLENYQREPGRTRKRSRWFIWVVVAGFVLVILLLLGIIGWLTGKLLEALF